MYSALTISKILDNLFAFIPRSSSQNIKLTNTAILPYHHTHKRNPSDYNSLLENENNINKSFWRKKFIFCLGIIFITFVILIIFGRSFLVRLLIDAESTKYPLSTVFIIVLLFIFVSLPFAWGYVLLNIASGYLYGLSFGTTLVFVSAFFGLVFAHIFLKILFGRLLINNLLQNDAVLSFIKLVEGHRGLKIVFLSRLTPIPFGLQNALFALSNISNIKYLVVSAVGLLPTQILNAYIGSTVRSMRDVILNKVDGNSTTIGYTIFSCQIIFTFVLLIYVAKKAKQEFDKSIKKQNNLTKTSVRTL